MSEYYDKKLWCDLKNDTERVEFLLCGRAHETGIIAHAIVNDVAAAFACRAKADGLPHRVYSRPLEGLIMPVRQLVDRIERFIDETEGTCGECGRPVVLVNGSDQTLNSNHTRYRYPENANDAWCIFRCRDCHAVISDNFVAA